MKFSVWDRKHGKYVRLEVIVILGGTFLEGFQLNVGDVL